MVGGSEVVDVPQEKSERRRRWKAKGHVSTSETRGVLFNCSAGRKQRPRFRTEWNNLHPGGRNWFSCSSCFPHTNDKVGGVNLLFSNGGTPPHQSPDQPPGGLSKGFC